MLLFIANVALQNPELQRSILLPARDCFKYKLHDSDWSRSKLLAFIENHEAVRDIKPKIQ